MSEIEKKISDEESLLKVNTNSSNSFNKFDDKSKKPQKVLVTEVIQEGAKKDMKSNDKIAETSVEKSVEITEEQEKGI